MCDRTADIMSAQNVPPGSSQAPPPNVQVFAINVPKNPRSHLHVLQLNAAIAAMNTDVARWKMVNEHKCGADCGEDATFYAFFHAKEGVVEAHQLHNDWYHFQPIKSQNPFRKETEYESEGRRSAMNWLSLMSEMSDDDDKRPDLQSIKVSAGPKGNKAMENDTFDWMNDISDSDEEKPKKKRMLSECPGEESNDGNKAVRKSGRISVSNDNGPSKSNGTGNSDHLSGKNLPRPLLMSGEVSVREKKSVDSDKKKDKVKKITNAKEAQEARDQMHWQEFVKRLKEDKADSSSKLSSHSQVNSKKERTNGSPVHKSWSVSLVNNKRRMTLPTYLGNSNRPNTTPAKRSKLDSIPLRPSSTNDKNAKGTTDGYEITESAVRRFLARKPMTTCELLTKFKTKKSGASSDQLVGTMTSILKRINPIRKTIEGKVYLTTKER